VSDLDQVVLVLACTERENALAIFTSASSSSYDIQFDFVAYLYCHTGGLDEVKELLRQCITYPLKYPRLYQVTTVV
jgi:SpoVK/Ycf46/Vps4 family AAA+-type ATPase